MLREAGLLTQAQADTLHVAHADLLQMGLACTLDLRSRIAARTPALEALCAGVAQVTAELGFDFSGRTEVSGSRVPEPDPWTVSCPAVQRVRAR